MESILNRNDIEPEIYECVVRVEKAIEELYLEWYWYPKDESKRHNFSYRIELDGCLDDKEGRIRIRSGSTGNRRTFYIGKSVPAIKGLLFLKEKLCDNAVLDLQKILSQGRVPVWTFIDVKNNLPCPYSPEFILGKINEYSKEINSNSTPLITDIYQFSGFFLDYLPVNKTNYRTIESSVNLLDDINLEQCICNAITEILPADSDCSFSATRFLGNYWTGVFQESPYQFYFDLGWREGSYLLKFLNIAGFSRTPKITNKINFGFNQIFFNPNN